MGVEYIEGGFKLKIGRRRTQVTTYENMPLQTTQPVKKDKQKEIKRNILLSGRLKGDASVRLKL